MATGSAGLEHAATNSQINSRSSGRRSGAERRQAVRQSSQLVGAGAEWGVLRCCGERFSVRFLRHDNTWQPATRGRFAQTLTRSHAEHSPVSATSSEKQKLFRYVNDVAAGAINRGSRLALQERSEVDKLSLMLAFDDANEGDLFEVCLRSESSSLHNGL